MGEGRKVVFLEVHAYYHDVSDANVRMHQQNVPLYLCPCYTIGAL